MDSEELEERIEAFPRWQYRFEFADGVRTRVSHEGVANRHAQRRRYVFDALLSLTGGTLRGRRVLDLGCNAGYFSLEAIDAGADFVLGVDAQQESVEQARLIFEAKNVEEGRYRFDQADVFAAPQTERFDIVLCLALLDASARPIELFDLMTGVGADLIVLDTGISRIGSSFFEIGAINDPRVVLDHKMVLVPSWQAMFELAKEFGLRIAPLAVDMDDYNGLDDYRRGRRLAFVLSRETPLDGLAQAKPPSLAPWWVTRLDPRR